MSLYLRKYKYFMKEVYQWNVVYCMGVWEVAFKFWFLKICTWFLGGAKVIRVEKSFLIKKNLKRYWAILSVYIWILLWNNVFYLVEFTLFGYVLNEFPSCECWGKKVRVLMKESNPNQRNPNFLKSPRAPWSYFFFINARSPRFENLHPRILGHSNRECKSPKFSRILGHSLRWKC